MEYMGHIFWNHLPYVDEEIRFINGKEQVCLIIPTDTNQIKRGKWGNWLSTFRILEERPNEQGTTHRIELAYRTMEDKKLAKKRGFLSRTARMGRLRELTPPHCQRDNSAATDVAIDGAICLDCIKDNMHVLNRQSNKVYVRCTFKQIIAGATPILLTGAICIDDIPADYIQTNPRTGKRNVRCRLKKNTYMDANFNTHHLVVITESGSEIEIGRFREWREAAKAQKRIVEYQAPTAQKVDESVIGPSKDVNIKIDGLNL